MPNSSAHAIFNLAASHNIDSHDAWHLPDLVHSSMLDGSTCYVRLIFNLFHLIHLHSLLLPQVAGVYLVLSFASKRITSVASPSVCGKCGHDSGETLAHPLAVHQDQIMNL